MSHRPNAFYRATFLCLFSWFLLCGAVTAQQVDVGFNVPDTVCVNTPVAITNTTVGAASHYWSFCVADLNQTPVGTNLGNLGGEFSMPVFMDYVYSNGNYYGFLINFNPGKLVRLDFGNSLLNTPTATDLGNVGGVMPLLVEGIQMVQNEGKWYAIIVAGYAGQGLSPRLIKIEFGADITNLAPIAMNWGNLGNMQQPIDLHVFQENGNWYGFTVNAENNTITRFNFSNSFDNTPTAVNLGNIGNLSYPTGIYAINDNNSWSVFVVNGGNNSRTGGTWSLTRLDFGGSLLNTPVGVNLGNPGGALKHPRDLTIMKSCGQIIGFAVNGAIGSSDIVKLDFKNNLLSIPVVSSIGNIGNLNFPHSIARIFRVGSDLYSFITNVGNNTLTRLQFSGCNNSNIPNSALQNPPAVTYTLPGTYNINLTINDGLPTQNSICKPVVVLPQLEHQPIQNLIACKGSIKIGTASPLGSHIWSTGATTDSIIVNTSGTYWVETNRYGCINRDSFAVTVVPKFQPTLGLDKEICQGSNVILDPGISGDAYSWNTGSVTRTISVNSSGTYYVRVTRNGCHASDTVKVSLVSNIDLDFNYEQNVCNPYSIQFKSKSGSPLNTYWNFGDGNSITGAANPIHTYTSAGSFIVKYATGNGNCVDTINKTVTVDIIQENLIHTQDTTICFGGTARLRTAPALSFCWSPTTYLDNPNLPNPLTSTPHDITYYFTAQTTGVNLIVNGSFTQGNTGFTSTYNYATTNITEGQYFVGSNPRAWNSSLSACGDRTTGNGNMMLVNGSPVADVNVWRQTVNVTPNTNYAFSTWIQALWPPNPAQLQFSINGQITGTVITASLPTCNWTQFYTTWNSGSNTSAVISIVNKNTQIQGNDFALDDISFAEVFIKRDSVKILVEKPKVTSIKDTSICQGSSIQFLAIGAQSYSWSPAVGLSASNIPNPIAKPTAPVDYIVTGTSVNGCIAADTVRIDFHVKPAMTISRDTTICKNSPVELSVTGGISYEWWPSATLNSAFIGNPVATPALETKYFVKIIDANSCDYMDSVVVSVRPEPVFSINKPQTICSGDSVQLNATGGDAYIWYPSSDISDAYGPNPKVSPARTTNYSVKITENVCNVSTTLSTLVEVETLPNVAIFKSNDIDCRNLQSQLIATGADFYKWQPNSSLNNLSIPNPIATPIQSSEYVVTGTSANGCSKNDTINVAVYSKPDIQITKDTVICKNSNIQLFVSGGANYSWAPAELLSDASVYNPIAFPTAQTKFYVTVTDSIACEYLDSVIVSLKPEPQFTVADIDICNNASGSFEAGGGDIYVWSPSFGLSDVSVANPTVFPGNSRSYSVTITELECNHSATLNASVNVLPIPIVQASKVNDIDCSQSASQLNVTGAITYSWLPSESLNNKYISNPIATPNKTTEYIVKGIDANGCMGYDTITVKVEGLNQSSYYVPNAFTPNNDGLNDCFRIKYWGLVNEFEFSVYNRWGVRIFFTKDPNNCWDGRFKGILQDAGVYVYLIKAKTFCQPEVFRKGTFVLIH